MLDKLFRHIICCKDGMTVHCHDYCDPQFDCVCPSDCPQLGNYKQLDGCHTYMCRPIASGTKAIIL